MTKAQLLDILKACAYHLRDVNLDDDGELLDDIYGAIRDLEDESKWID